jgi:hypothetical protein
MKNKNKVKIALARGHIEVKKVKISTTAVAQICEYLHDITDCRTKSDAK